MPGATHFKSALHLGVITERRIDPGPPLWILANAKHCSETSEILEISEVRVFLVPTILEFSILVPTLCVRNVFRTLCVP